MAFAPRFSLDDIKWDLEQLETERFRIERILLMPKHEAWFRREAFVRTTYSSTMIEDSSIPTEEVEEAIKAAPTGVRPTGRPTVDNYSAALTLVDAFSEVTDIQPSEGVIRMVHKVLMRGLNDYKYHPGEYRLGPNWIEDQGIKVYEPPMHIDVPILMQEFSQWLREDNPDLHPVVRAGIAHVRLVAIHPFVDGNGRTARLLAALLLQRSQWGFKRLLSLDSYYQRSRDEYINALKNSLGPRFDAEVDMTPWLAFFCRSLTIQARMLEDKLTKWRMTVDGLHKEARGWGLKERQIDALIYASRAGSLTRKDYVEIAGVAPVTATHDLSELVQRGFLVPRGNARNRRFYYAARQEAESQFKLGV